MSIEPLSLMYVHDHFKMQEMCNEAVEENPYMLRFVPDHFKTPEMCEMVVEEDQLSLDLLITLIHKRCLMMQWGGDPSSLECVPDWFVTQ